MDRIPQTPPAINPVVEGVSRPLWSVMIPVYNCAAFLPEAMASVLAQDPGEGQMQIEVVDDCSTDADVEALVKTIGSGRVQYYRQPQNVGSLRNFETCINRAKGHLVHLLHGDDKVKPGFYTKIQSLFEAYPQAGAAFCRYAFINATGEITHYPTAEAKQDGILSNWLLRIAERQRTQYAATVVKREVYEKLGSFYGMSYAEDWEMWVRIAKHYPVAYTPELLAEYRVHANSISSIKVSNDKALADYLHAIHFIQGHLSEDQRRQVLKKSVKDCAFFKINKANLILKESNNRRLVISELKQAFQFSKHPDVLFHAFKICIKMSIGLR
ncbi:MAG TPA: glycosyltransferase [Flavisolibacter sp.]|jgi:glycosyltransferase involved in cell wall biosynthesis|nr:glycosyltransferase [Flavisolibacter sp.]